jgi:hypothetical protein
LERLNSIGTAIAVVIVGSSFTVGSGPIWGLQLILEEIAKGVLDLLWEGELGEALKLSLRTGKLLTRISFYLIIANEF